MASARDALTCIRAATARFPVYATEELDVDHYDQVKGPLDQHDPQIYGALPLSITIVFGSPRASAMRSRTRAA